MKRSILIVDDEAGLADVVADLLAERQYEASIAINGRHGLAALASKRPDLVLLDVMMPILDGRQMLRAMRLDPNYGSIPVVMMTSLPEALPKDTPSLYQGWIHKPFSIEKLLATIEAAFGRH